MNFRTRVLIFPRIQTLNFDSFVLLYIIETWNYSVNLKKATTEK